MNQNTLSYILWTADGANITIVTVASELIRKAQEIYDAFPADYWACTRP